MRFIATDGGIPLKTSPEATLTVNVNRNQFPPEILNLPSVKNITENQAVNVEVFRVTGRDNDTVVSLCFTNLLPPNLNVNIRYTFDIIMTCILKAPFNSFSYELVGDGSATTFFQISSGGSVSLRQSVATDSSNMFQVLGISFQHLYHIRNKLCLNFSRKKII